MDPMRVPDCEMNEYIEKEMWQNWGSKAKPLIRSGYHEIEMSKCR
jgi:hypothetical protein